VRVTSLSLALSKLVVGHMFILCVVCFYACFDCVYVLFDGKLTMFEYSEEIAHVCA
jgi:hypothetical protein